MRIFDGIRIQKLLRDNKILYMLTFDNNMNLLRIDLPINGKLYYLPNEILTYKIVKGLLKEIEHT